MSNSANSKEVYKASLDIFSKIMTSFIFLLSVVGLILMFTVPPWYGGLFLLMMGLVLLPGFYIYSVKAYALTDEKLIIQRPFARFNKEIMLYNITSAELEQPGDFKWTARTAGNGGLFGYSGSFVNNQIGNFTMYTTNRKNRIIIKLKHPHKTIVISPDDKNMAESLNKKLLALK